MTLTVWQSGAWMAAEARAQNAECRLWRWCTSVSVSARGGFKAQI